MSREPTTAAAASATATPPVSRLAAPLDYADRSLAASWWRNWMPARHRAGFVLLLILLVAAALRVYEIGTASFWWDEFFSVEVPSARGYVHLALPENQFMLNPPELTRLSAAAPWYRIWTSLSRDAHPPLYYLAMRAWREAFGESDVSARALSVVFSLLAIVFLYDAAKQLHGRVVALWACAIMALASPQIEYAQEARSYTMTLALILATCAALARIERLGGTLLRAAALGAAALSAALTHYFALAPVAALGLYALLRLRGREFRFALIGFTAAAAIYLIAWGPMLWSQRVHFRANTDWAADNESGQVLRTFDRLAMLPLKYLMVPMNGAETVGRFGVVLFVLPLLMLRRRPDLLMWCLLMYATLALVLVPDLVRRSWGIALVRYTLPATAAMYVLAAAMLSHVRLPWLHHAVPAALTLACLLSLGEAHRRYKADWRGAAQYLDRYFTRGEAVVFCGGSSDYEYADVAFLAVSYYSQTFPWPAAILTQPSPPPEPLATDLRRAPGVWAIAPTLEDALAALPGARKARALRVVPLGFIVELKPREK